MPRWFAIAALATSFVCAGPAFAAPDAPATAATSADDVKAAGEEFDLGKRAFKKKDWVEAAEHFEKADLRAPSAAAIELAMRARDKAGQLDRAATLGALAVDRHGDSGELAKSAQALMKKADGQFHKLRVRCTPACDLVLGTKLVHGRAATERTLYIEAGNASVNAGWSGGRTRSASVQATKGGSSEVSFEAPPEDKAAGGAEPAKAGEATPTPTPVNTPEKTPEQDQTTQKAGGLPPVIFFVGAGLTAVAGGITIWSGLDTQNNPGKDKVREACVGQGEDCPEYQDGLKRQRRTNILLGVTGGLAVVTGVVGVFFTDWRGKKTEQASVEPFMTLGLGASVGARGRF